MVLRAHHRDDERAARALPPLPGAHLPRRTADHPGGHRADRDAAAVRSRPELGRDRLPRQRRGQDLDVRGGPDPARTAGVVLDQAASLPPRRADRADPHRRQRPDRRQGRRPVGDHPGVRPASGRTGRRRAALDGHRPRQARQHSLPGPAGRPGPGDHRDRCRVHDRGVLPHPRRRVVHGGQNRAEPRRGGVDGAPDLRHHRRARPHRPHRRSAVDRRSAHRSARLAVRGQARVRPGGRRCRSGADLAVVPDPDAAGAAEFARTDLLRTTPGRPRRSGLHVPQVPVHAPTRGVAAARSPSIPTARRAGSRARTGAPGSASSCAPPRWTNCRS